MKKHKAPKIAISGYYGFDNCGDEAVLLAIIHSLRKLIPDAKIVVFSANPKKTQALFGVKAVNRWNPVIMALEILSCRLFISGGGSLLQDATGPRSVRYYLGTIRFALLFRKKTMIYSQGIGPLSNEKSRSTVAKVLSRCHAISVRDAHSAQLLEELGIRRDVHVACDPVMALSADDAELTQIEVELGGLGICASKSGGHKPLLLAAIRCWQDNRHVAHVAKLLDAQISRGWDVLLIPAHFPEDTEAMSKTADAMEHQPYCLAKCLTAGQFIALTCRADLVFSMRLHGLICAMAAGTPMLALSYDPKVDAFMEQIGLNKYCLPFEGFDSSAAVPLLEELSLLPDRVVSAMQARRAELRTLAVDSAIIAARMLNVEC